MKQGNFLALGLFVIVIVMSFLGFALAGDITTFSANIFPPNIPTSSASVQVPDHIFLGNITVGHSSAEFKVYMNNTGTTNIHVTPILLNTSDPIMNNLYFRKFQTSGGNPVAYTRVGGFTFNITKPVSGQTFNDEYFYVILDLSNYTGDVQTILMNYEAQVKFIAVSY